MINNYNLFKDEGHILLKEFIINDNFDQICINLKREILEEYKNLDKKKIGGHVMGNLNVSPGKYSQIIFDFLIKNGLKNIVENITNDKFSEFDIIIEGNLNLPNGFDQHFHTDGSFDDKMIIISLATENINEFNGPLEIFCDSHKQNLPYWKFFLKKKNTIKFLLSKGDVVIRKSELWHRGNKNLSNQPRFMFGVILKKKENKINPFHFEKNQKIKIYDNFFKPSFFGKIEENIYTKFRYIYIFIRLIKSFF